MEEFNPAEFIKRPPVILRLISILFAIVVFGCISSGGYDSTYGVCLYNGDSGACHYGVGIGVMAFLICIVFLAIDSQYDTITNPENKRIVTMADLAFSGLWSFLWFVCFCYLADKWRQMKGVTSTSQTNNCQAAIAFSFFSILTWFGLAVMAFMKYRRSPDDFDYNKDNLAGESYPSPYAPFPPNTSEAAGDPYQSQPFSDDSRPEGQGTGTNPSEVPSEFKQPSY